MGEVTCGGGTKIGAAKFIEGGKSDAKLLEKFSL
jgi:hypothetical protein